MANKYMSTQNDPGHIAVTACQRPVLHQLRNAGGCDDERAEIAAALNAPINTITPQTLDCWNPAGAGAR